MTAPRTPSPQTTEGLGATPLTALWADLEAASREPGPTMTITKAQYAALRGAARLSVPSEALDAPSQPRKLCPHCDGRGTVGAEDTDPAILAAAPRYDGHEFYEDALPREPGLCDYTMPDGDWCGRPLSFHWHNREAAQRERLREAIGTSGEDSGLEHWHYARGGRTSPDERAGVFVDRQQVLDAIDRVLG